MSTLSTRVTELVGCRYPVQLAGMPRTAIPELVGAVSQAGGLGMLGAARYRADGLIDALTEIASRTSAPFGVTFLVPFLDPDLIDLVAQHARVVELYWGTPEPALVDRIHAHGALASWQVGSLADAGAAERAGCDLVVLQGIEAGGHVCGTRPLADVIAEVRTEITIPFLAAGGIATSADLHAALDAGADGVRCGTIFVAATESGAHPDYQRALIAASRDDTDITTAFSTGWPNAPHRVLKSCIAALANAPDNVGSLTDGPETIALPRGATPNPTRGTTGLIAAMPHYAGYSVDAVTSIRPAADIVNELIGITDPVDNTRARPAHWTQN